MTRLLVVAYYFPPRGGAGTQRFAKFCKYLPEFGVTPIVLTSGAVDTGRNAPHDDPSLVGCEGLAIERVDAPERASLRRRVLRKLRFFLDEDEWADAAADRAAALVQHHRPDAVITTLSPFACYRIGVRLQREFGLPWLVDLRDPWALDGWRRYRSPLHANRDLAHMRRALRAADCVIANVPAARMAFLGLGAAAQRTVVIPNGYDPDDFSAAGDGGGEGAAADDRSRVLPDDGTFRLVHMGTFHPVDAPEGFTRNRPWLLRHRQIAPLGRTGYYLLHAAALLREQQPAAFARLRIDLFGHVDGSHRALIDRLGLHDTVTMHGYVSHMATTTALLEADAVFVPLHDVPAGERALVVPGKLYEALASERPVLAALPEGDGRDLVEMLGAGRVVAPTDSAALADAMARLLQSARGSTAGCSRARLEPLTRRHLTGLLAAAVGQAVARAPTIAVVSPWAALGSKDCS